LLLKCISDLRKHYTICLFLEESADKSSKYFNKFVTTVSFTLVMRN